MNSRNLKKKGEEYRNILTQNFNYFIKDLNHKLQIILMTQKKGENSENCFFFCSFDEWIYSPRFSFFFFFLQEDLDLLLHLRWNIKRIKMYRRWTVNNSGTKFNMKHSLKPWTSSTLGRAQRRTDRWGPHRQPPSAPPAASWSFLPAPPPASHKKGLHTRNGSVKHSSLHNFPNLHQICHNPQSLNIF